MRESSLGPEKVRKGWTRAVGLEEGREHGGMIRSWTGRCPRVLDMGYGRAEQSSSEAGVDLGWGWGCRPGFG